MLIADALVIDGDDTLWENNIYFERAIEEFIDFLDHSRLQRDQVRGVLDEVERLNSGVHGYGSAAFGRNLRQTYERLSERRVDEVALEHVMGLARRIAQVDMPVIADVRETVEYLSARYRLLLFTKGQPDEQRLKVDRSGLRPFFEQVVVAAEKDVAAYQALATEQQLTPGRTWMVGNSPRSDIQPALAAGLGAVYIPHPHTWALERAELPRPNGRLLVLERFGQLREYF